MGLWGSIFGDTSTVSKATDALISAGDKLVYTDEEKADMNYKATKLHIELLEASHPFKLTQRVLAFYYSFLYGIGFITGLAMTIFNIIAKYKDKNATQLEVQQLFDLIGVFSIGGIALAIVVFYFGGGSVESFKRAFGKK
jgi:hypothetical protein